MASISRRDALRWTFAGRVIGIYAAGGQIAGGGHGPCWGYLVGSIDSH